MFKLLEIIKRDTSSWESHSIFENLFDDFQIAALLRTKSKDKIKLLNLENDLMEVQLEIHLHQQSMTWALRGHLAVKFSMDRDYRWPEKFAKRYISNRRAQKDLVDSVVATIEAVDSLCAHYFNIVWTDGGFDTGQLIDLSYDKLIWGGNYYSKRLEHNLISKLFRAELILIATFLLYSFTSNFQRMIPRPIDTEDVTAAIDECAHVMFSVMLGQMTTHRVDALAGEHLQYFDKVKKDTWELQGFNLQNSVREVDKPSKITDLSNHLTNNTYKAVECALEANDLEVAINHLQRSLKMYSGHLYDRWKLTRIYLWLGQKNRAFNELGKLVDLLSQSGSYNAALNHLAVMESLVPEDPRVAFKKAEMESRLGFKSTATKTYQKAGELFLKAGDEQGVNLVRERLAGIWWLMVPAIEQLSMEEILRLDFYKDFGYWLGHYARKQCSSKERNAWDGNEQPIPFYAVKRISRLKRLVKGYEKTGNKTKQRAAYEKIAIVYECFGHYQETANVYIAMAAKNQGLAEYFLTTTAQFCSTKGLNKESAEIWSKLEKHYLSTGDSSLAKKASQKAEEQQEDFCFFSFDVKLESDS